VCDHGAAAVCRGGAGRTEQSDAARSARSSRLKPWHQGQQQGLLSPHSEGEAAGRALDKLRAAAAAPRAKESEVLKTKLFIRTRPKNMMPNDISVGSQWHAGASDGWGRRTVWVHLFKHHPLAVAQAAACWKKAVRGGVPKTVQSSAQATHRLDPAGLTDGTHPSGALTTG